MDMSQPPVAGDLAAAWEAAIAEAATAATAGATEPAGRAERAIGPAAVPASDPAEAAAAVAVPAVSEAAAFAQADQDQMAALAATLAPADPAEADDARRPAEEIYLRIGLLTRTLHNALRELGYDKQLSDVKENLPDARDRLTYIARVTGEAAERVLNGVDRARVVQEEVVGEAARLRTRWRAVAKYMEHGNRATPAGQQLVEETCRFFDGVGGQADATNAILTDIMMAQDFHDLTGQVIRKVVTLATTLEEQLVKLLIEAQPPEQRRAAAVAASAAVATSAATVAGLDHPVLEGPVVNFENRDDVVTDQAGVDDLLASLGF